MPPHPAIAPIVHRLQIGLAGRAVMTKTPEDTQEMDDALKRLEGAIDRRGGDRPAGRPARQSFPAAWGLARLWKRGGRPSQGPGAAGQRSWRCESAREGAAAARRRGVRGAGGGYFRGSRGPRKSL